MHTSTEIQRFLAINGFDPGPIDGVIGQHSIDAINAYLAKQGQPSLTQPYTLVSINNALWPPAPAPLPTPGILDNLSTLFALLTFLEGKTMTADQITGILRAILAAIGGYLVSKGVIDAATATSVAGAVVTLLTGIWSIYSNRPKTIVPLASK